MNRRSFLSMFGLAPVAACSAALLAIALPKPDGVKDAVTVKLELDTTELRNMMDEIARDQALMLENVPMYDRFKHGDDFYAWFNRIVTDPPCH